MSNASDAWHSFEVILDWDADECPTVERPIPLELIRSTDRERWADSCPTLKTQVPPELVAESVPPPNGEGELRFAASPDHRTMHPALVLSIAFLASAVMASMGALILRYGLGL